MPSLRELDAHFKRWFEETSNEKDEQGRYVWRDEKGEIWSWSQNPWSDRFTTVESLAEADGIWFDCPLCWQKWKAGAEHGPHGVLIWFEGRRAPDRLGRDSQNRRVRWTIQSGTGLDDLQLTPSILLSGPGCGWHGFVGSSGVPPGHAA